MSSPSSEGLFYEQLTELERLTGGQIFQIGSHSMQLNTIQSHPFASIVPQLDADPEGVRAPPAARLPQPPGTRNRGFEPVKSEEHYGMILHRQSRNDPSASPKRTPTPSAVDTKHQGLTLSHGSSISQVSETRTGARSRCIGFSPETSEEPISWNLDTPCQIYGLSRNTY